MKKLFFFLFIQNLVFSQYTFNKGYDNLEIRGNITTYYKYRWYPNDSIETDNKQEKNLFKLKDARIKLEGSINKRKIEYEMHLDFAKLKDNEQPLMDAYVTFNNKLETTVGFTKLPFSRHSKTAIIYQPWLKRAQIIDEGQQRRDIGLHLSYGILNDKIQLFSSIVDGEKDLVSDNDASGNLEYIGRIELAYPTKMKYRSLDLAHSSTPIFSLGSSYRSSTKSETDVFDEIIYYKINGTKKSYEFDFAIMYKGFSFLAEAHSIDYLWENSQRENSNTIGLLIEGNYLLKRYNSVFALRYDHTDINGTVSLPGIQQQTISIGYNYRFNEHMNVLKIQFRREIYDGNINSIGDLFSPPLNTSNPFKNEIRIGLQYIIG